MNPLGYPIEGMTVIHAGRASGEVGIHTLSFYMQHTYEESKLYVFRPNNPRLGEITFKILSKWYQLGTYFDETIKEKQESAHRPSPQKTFTHLRSVKQHFLGSYSNFYVKQFASQDKNFTHEKGVTCHSLLIDAVNLASLQLLYKSQKVPLSEDSLSLRVSNYGALHKSIESPALHLEKKKESEKHRKQGPYVSPVNFLTLTQRQLVENGSVLSAMPFQINSKVATINEFFTELKNANIFKLIGVLDKKTLSLLFRESNIFKKWKPGYPSFTPIGKGCEKRSYHWSGSKMYQEEKILA